MALDMSGIFCFGKVTLPLCADILDCGWPQVHALV